jgi:hypothetical protein
MEHTPFSFVVVAEALEVFYWVTSIDGCIGGREVIEIACAVPSSLNSHACQPTWIARVVTDHYLPSHHSLNLFSF